MNHRKLQHRIRIERSAKAPKRGGGTVETWTLIADPLAEVIDQRLRERMRAYGEAAETTIAFRFWSVPGVEILSSDQLVYDGKVLDIIDIMPAQADPRMVEIIAKRVSK